MSYFYAHAAPLLLTEWVLIVADNRAVKPSQAGILDHSRSPLRLLTLKRSTVLSLSMEFLKVSERTAPCITRSRNGMDCHENLTSFDYENQKERNMCLIDGFTEMFHGRSQEIFSESL